MTILVSGSLAFDRLAEYSGRYTDSILLDKLSILNVAFLVESVVRVHGGTAGNIAYNLTLLGEKPLVVSSLGGDPDGSDYVERLKGWGLSLEAVNIAQGLPTAGAYIATDSTKNQLTFFNPGAMAEESPFKAAGLEGAPGSHLAIVSPGGLSDMLRLPGEYRRKGVPFIFDPGQQVSAFSREELLGMLEGSSMLMTNEYELDLFLSKCGMKENGLFSYTKTVLTTLGEKGSRLFTASSDQHIAAAPVSSARNPTGAGDAYRAGLLKGMASGLDLLRSCRLGAAVAAFCVEAEGTQEHSFTLSYVKERYKATFSEELPLKGCRS
jgi:adenosine kinase